MRKDVIKSLIAIKQNETPFDEIQHIKDWEYFVLRLYKTYCKNIYVCGSNATCFPPN